MSYNGIFQNILRIGVIDSVDYKNQKCNVRMYDRVEDRMLSCPLPQTATGTDQGLFFNPEPGSMALIGWGYSQRPFIVSMLPNSAFTQDFSSQTNVSNIPVGAAGYPMLQKGEVALTGQYGSKLLFKNTGAVKLASIDSSVSFEDATVLSESKNSVSVSEGGYYFSGIVLRDLRKVASDIESTKDKKTSISFMKALSQVGREPTDKVSILASSSNQSNGQTFRNPAFIEDRKIVTEFAGEYEVGTVDEEKERHSVATNSSFLFQPNRRSNAGYDVLNLNLDNPNTLYESVLGTVVDIYGNILDINRNIIPYGNDPQQKNDPNRIKYLAALTRRSIKMHYELNARKETTGAVSPTVLDGPDLKIGHSHSRWSIDVDGEGLTKVNIPSSSNIGNIPLLSRYVTGQMANSSQATDPDSLRLKTDIVTGQDRPTKDIHHLAFGDLDGGGVSIPDEYAPTDLGGRGKIKYRTAYHDIVTTAPLALRALPSPGAAGTGAFGGTGEGSTFGDVANISGSSPTPTSPGQTNFGENSNAIISSLFNLPSVDGSIEDANAGGRSLFANLDGSLELNIGRDFIDNKSVVIDTAGGILSRIGKMRDTSQNASIISQLDGSVFIQVGGDAVADGVDKTKTETLADPRVRLVVSGSYGTDEIIIDEKYMKLKTAGEGSKDGRSGKNIILQSSRDIILNAEGRILLMGRSVGVHGEVDVDGQITKGPERMIVKNGKVI